jgi:hypothetical protein
MPHKTALVSDSPSATKGSAAATPTPAAAAASAARCAASACRAVSGRDSTSSARPQSSSPRVSLIAVSRAQQPTMTINIQPPSHTANPPAVSTPLGTPCIIRTAVDVDSSSSFCRDASSG